ncbi:MAG: oligosaccharide flippase family protein, partial [Bacteroidota bacterium]
MRYAKGVLITLISKALAIAVGILSSIIIARYLGPSGRGVLAVLIVILATAMQFGSFGFNASMTYFIARDKKLSSPIASNSLIVAITLGIIIALFFFLIGQFSPAVIIGEVDVVYLNILLIAIPFGFLRQFMQNIFIAQQRIYDFNLLDLFSRLIQFIGFGILLVLLGLGTYEAVLCFAVVTVISGLMYLFRSSQFTEIKLRFDAPLFTGMLRYGVRTYIASFLMFLVIRSNIMLINYFLGESQSGVYSVAMQFADLVYLLPATLGLILFPKVSESIRDPGELT